MKSKKSCPICQSRNKTKDFHYHNAYNQDETNEDNLWTEEIYEERCNECGQLLYGYCKPIITK